LSKDAALRSKVASSKPHLGATFDLAAEAFEAVCSKPSSTARSKARMTPSPRRCRRARLGGPCFIQVEAAVVDRMRAMRRPGEDYSDVILRLIEIEAGRR
jgi:hypothetical protein